MTFSLLTFHTRKPYNALRVHLDDFVPNYSFSFVLLFPNMGSVVTAILSTSKVPCEFRNCMWWVSKVLVFQIGRSDEHLTLPTFDLDLDLSCVWPFSLFPFCCQSRPSLQTPTINTTEQNKTKTNNTTTTQSNRTHNARFGRQKYEQIKTREKKCRDGRKSRKTERGRKKTERLCPRFVLGRNCIHPVERRTKTL